MARRKKGLGIFRTIILIILLILIVTVLVMLLMKKVKLEKDTEEIKEDETHENINEEVTISCDKYDVYFDEDDKLGFNFIIAELCFETKADNLYYDLRNIKTGEKETLDAVSVNYYIEKIKAFNYDISKFNLLDSQFTAEGTYLKGNVFIPFKTSKNELCIYNGEQITFDLSKNKHSIVELLYDVKTEDIKTEKYDISISTSYEENMFVTSDTQEEFACHYALAFELYVNKITASNVHIEQAKFIPDDALSGEGYEALDEHVDSYRIKNIIGKTLKDGDRYGLFFQMDENSSTRGTIMIKFSDSDKWMELREG